ncbi:HlyD family secretion protein [Aquimarina celericrescens]|uniref:HlyD family secretion protein n=1 Tax=Aquimarina celericrescens TaxID=1964542 RepID=A0ABW5AVW0_9FLAO|nr:HlyD family efflux transporter periplasmic adaptor subunit [Aquimarina celericrescens]
MPNSLNNIDLRSEEVQEVLSQTPNWMIQWGSLLLLILILMVLFLSYLIKYPDVILSESSITTELPPEKVYSKIDEKIEVILVNDGDIVKKNTPLAILKNNANYKDVLFLKSIVDTISLNNKFFSFPSEKLPILFLGDISADYALFENSYSEYLLNKQLQPFSNETVANISSLSELKQRLQSALSQKEINSKELLLQRKDLERLKKIFERGVISEQEFENKKLEILKAERSYAAMSASISQIREAIGTMKKNSKGNLINETKENIKLFKNVIQSFNQLKKSIKNWELLYVLKSNIDGRVTFLNYWSTTQSVSAGDLIFSIIPSKNTRYVGKLQAPSRNSGKIKVGQKVNIKLENYPETEFGVLQGVVNKVSLLPNQDHLYLIDVSLPDKLITSYQKEIDFKQEMKGSAEIITEDLRLIERFFYQFKKIIHSKT